MPAGAQGHTAALLGNNTVLIAGGLNGSTTLSAARLYDPSLGLTCSSNSQCASGFCVSGVCCDTSCTDQCKACNLGGALTGTCSPKPNGTACNDANACTLTDACQSGSCAGSNPKTCTASDQCHVAGTCDPTTGTCSDPVAANGTACSDGNSCTSNDVCQAGSCAGVATDPLCGFPPTTILTCTPGSTMAGCVTQVVTQVGGTKVPQMPTVLTDLGRLATLPGFAAALANDVRAKFNPNGQPEEILTQLSMLGFMRTPEGTVLLREIVHMPVPAADTCESTDGQCSQTVYTFIAASKAIDGLGFLQTAEGDAELLAAVADGSRPAVQARAVTAYLFYHGNSPANRTMLAGMLPNDRRYLVDRFIKDVVTTRLTTGQNLIAFYNLHPELLPPHPQF
jgi:hypothetical protein